MEKSFKDAILDTCEKRDDDVANKVRVRIQGAISDLHAADARYHKDCKDSFMGPRNVVYAQKKPAISLDNAFERLCKYMKDNDSKIWNSVELHLLYISFEGIIMTRKSLVNALCGHFGDTLLVLSSVGVASVVVFHNKASGFFKLDVVSEDDDVNVSRLAKQIKKECLSLKQSRDCYQTRDNMYDAESCSSPTLLQLLYQVSSSFQNSLPSALIGNIVTGIVAKCYTPLQVALGVSIREKKLIEQLCKFGVCCTYDEVRRFKTSAAKTAISSQEHHGLLVRDSSLIQAVVDNFDANLSTQN